MTKLDADISLASAALRSEPAALTALDALLRAEIPGFVSRLRLAPHEVDELIQRTRELLLVGPAPKLAEYAGRGPLGAWLRVVVNRLATRERRAEHESLDDETQHAMVAHSPEHQLARSRWQLTFDAALKDAFAALTPEQRALFRFQFGKGLTLEQISEVMGIHRATVARHIAEARETLWAQLTGLLRERLQLPADEVNALLAEWRSKLDLSLSGVLRESR